ncbi:MAG: ABC transporter permease [bacterium]|nr:ABC transporter permease [bacterium]
MRRLGRAIRQDTAFQFRHGFYHVYALVSIGYAVVLRALPPDLRALLAPPVIFSDPGIIGFFLVAAMILLERGQGVLDVIFVTPLRLHEYLLAKVVSIALLATASSVAIVLLTFGLAFRPLPLLAGAALTAAFFTLFGLALSCRARSLTDFLILGPWPAGVFLLPVLEHLDVVPASPLLGLLPGRASLALLGGALTGLGTREWLASLLSLGAWTALAYLWAHRRFTRFVVLREAGR